MKSSIRTLLADDEPLARRTLRHFAEGDPDLEVVGVGRDSLETGDLLVQSKPELALLDIEMPGGGVFDSLGGLAEPPVVVFVTAHAEYAVRAFEVEAIDYLLKPFDDSRFSRAIERAKAEVYRRRNSAMPVDTAPERRIALPGRNGTTLIASNEIDWIEAADYYVSVHVGSQEHLLREPLQSLEARLDPARFVRIHRSVLVNLRRVRLLEADAVILHDGTRLRLSRRRRENLRARLRS